MKKHILFLTFLSSCLFFSLLSCKNKVDNSSSSGNLNPSALDISKMTEMEKLKTFSSDPDYQTIASKNVIIINRLLNANIDLATFDFNNEAAFLKAIDMTKADYLQSVIEVKNAAVRFNAKYSINSQNVQTCVSCQANENKTKIQDFRAFLIDMKNNESKYSEFNGKLLFNYSTGKMNPVGTMSSISSSTKLMSNLKISDSAPRKITASAARCCSNWVYVCIGICAATIEAFPVYLACSAYCVHTECCT